MTRILFVAIALDGKSLILNAYIWQVPQVIQLVTVQHILYTLHHHPYKQNFGSDTHSLKTVPSHALAPLLKRHFSEESRSFRSLSNFNKFGRIEAASDAALAGFLLELVCQLLAPDRRSYQRLHKGNFRKVYQLCT